MTSEQAIILGFIALAYVAGWVTHELTAGRRRADRAASNGAAADRAAGAAGSADRAAGNGRPTLVEEVSDALRSDAANESMLSLGPADGASLTDVELDLTDWGFTYGVAWALARERWPDAPDDVIARAALRAANAVFGAYAGGADWKERPAEHPSLTGDELPDAIESGR